MTDITNKFDSEIVIKNLSQICNQDLEKLPYWETIQDVFINMNIIELRNIGKYIVKALLRSKMFDKYKYKGIYFDMIKYVDNKKSIGFHYITNFDVNNNNIKNIVQLGRKRWKIENEGFYTQKHRTFDITHLNSRNDNAMKCHYLFIQIAHTIKKLLEQGNILIKSLKLKIKEVSNSLLITLTSTITSLNNIDINFQLRFDT